MADDAPKLIVDDDWKQQAQAEKAKLAEQEKQAKADAAEPGRDPNAPVGFIDLVQKLASESLLYLGQIPDPQTGRAIVAPEYAKMNIDLLGVLQEKTKGNLSEEEADQLGKLLDDLRMMFVEISKAVAKAVEEGKISPQGGPVGGGVGGLEGDLGGMGGGVPPIAGGGVSGPGL